MNEHNHVLIIFICILFSALFSGMEIAFVSADKLSLELIRKKGGLGGWMIGYFQKYREHFIATLLVGNNLALVIYGIYMAYKIEPYLHVVFQGWPSSAIWILLVQSVISTFLVLITAEFLPKSLFMVNQNFLMRFFSVPMAVIYWILYPVVLPILVFSKLIITKIFKFEYSEDKPAYGLTDLNNFIKQHVEQSKTDEQQSVDARIFNNALEFKDVKVRECMVPRTEIFAVDVESSINELKEVFMESGHSKILVYKENIDDVIGYCHSSAMFKKPESIKKILTPIIIVPETAPANELLIQFINEHKSLALVVDEFGGTSGIISMEDVIEEIFGEIRDEHDDEKLVEDKIDDNTYILSARHEIDYLNEKYGLDLIEGDYDTLGGLILQINENIPEVEEIIIGENHQFTILSVDENKIDQVKLEMLQP